MPGASRPRSSRLKGRRHVRPLFERDSPIVWRVTSGTVRILARTSAYPNSGYHVKAGVAVGKKSGRAVDRTRVRRLFREAIRHSLPDIEECVPRDQLLTFIMLYRGNKDRMDRVRDDADRGLLMIRERLQARNA